MERIFKFVRTLGRALYSDDAGSADSSSSAADLAAMSRAPASPATSSSSSSSILSILPESSRILLWLERDDYVYGSFWNVVEHILLWEDVVDSLFIFFMLNFIFWYTIILDYGRFSAFLLVVLICVILERASYLELHVDFGNRVVFYSRFERLKQTGRKILYSLERLRSNQRGLFCILSCAISIGIWLLGNVISGVLFLYVVFMSILLVPILLLKVPSLMSLHSNQKESDSEIEEFLPAATETDIQVLTKAGDAGECSATPITTSLDIAASSITNEEQEFLNDVDLTGHKMPSHEDGSSDGLELSDLELSEKGSTPSSSNQSDSEFEIIDQRELDGFNGPRDSTL